MASTAAVAATVFDRRGASIGSIYCRAMATIDRGKGRGVDSVAARAALARLRRHDELPWLHGEIARRLLERLAPMRATPARIVEWWPGPGGGDDLLRAAYPRAARVAVEPDAAWAARRRTAARRPWWSRGTRAAAVVEESARDEEIGRAQLVWANMALAFVVDPPALFARWHALLEVEGLALFSCPGPGTLRELRALYAECGWPAPTPGYVDMHDLGDMLVAAGFADPVLDQETLTLRWRSAEALLAELRQLGGNTAPDRFVGLRTPAWRSRLVAALGARAAGDGSIALSVEIAYGHGFKPAPRLGGGAPVAVSLDEMRAMVRRPRSAR
jgi:malonyl-CoA O-methyltransferase